jgi:membrane protein DedA with SNARE-associated domain
MSGLRYRVFLFYNALGGLLWGVGYTLLGYIVGVSFEHVLSTVGLWSFAGVALVVVVIVLIRLVMKRRRRRRVAAEFAVLDPEAPGEAADGDGRPSPGASSA